MSSKRKRSAIVAFIAAIAIAFTFISVGSANAATGGDSDSTNCPVSTNGIGTGLVADPTLTVLANDVATTDSLLVGSTDTIVCIGNADQGMAWDNGDGTVSYGAYGSGTDQFIVGATDGTSYFSTTVQVTITTVELAKPTLTAKLKTKRVKVGRKHHRHYVTKVTRKAVVRFPGSTSYSEFVEYGTFGSTSPDGEKIVKKNGSLLFKTKRAKLDFVRMVIDADGNYAYVDSGSVNTKTGQVTVGVVTSNAVRARTKMSQPTPAQRWASMR